MKISIIGVGEMGFPMAKNLIEAGYDVTGYELREDRRQALAALGADARAEIDASIAQSDLVITCLPSSDAFTKLAEGILLSLMKSGQTLIECGTTRLFDMKRIIALFAQKGISVIDAPMSGGPMGVENKKLQVFVGCAAQEFEKLLPMFAAYGGPEMIYHCGEAGMGQVAKGVNQLYLGLISATCTEILAYAMREKLDPALIHTMFDAKFPALKYPLAQIEKDGHPGVKFRELPYYFEHAEHEGYELPIARTVYDFMKDGERVAFDDHRDAPSYYHELMSR